jgi:hypothetical protein
MKSFSLKKLGSCFILQVVLACFVTAQDSTIDYTGCRVYGLGAYEADYISGLPESAPSGHIKVEIGLISAPIVLVLSGYDPMTWDISNPHNVEIRQIIKTGFNTQSITGVTNVPMLSESGRTATYAYKLDYRTGSDYLALEAYVQSITGMGFTTFQGAYDGMFFIIREPNSISYDSCEVHGVDVEQGAGPVPTYQYTPRGSVTVEIGAVNGPIVLVLTAYYPVKWIIENPHNAEIKEVIVGGYYQGSVTGIHDSVPILATQNYEGNDRSYVVYTRTGQGYDTYQSAITGSNFLIEGSTRAEQKIRSSQMHGIKISPNPFTGSVSVSYTLEKTEKVNMAVYDPAGRLIRTLINVVQEPGSHEIYWNAANGTNGFFILKSEIGNSFSTARLFVVR